MAKAGGTLPRCREPRNFHLRRRGPRDARLRLESELDLCARPTAAVCLAGWPGGAQRGWEAVRLWPDGQWVLQLGTRVRAEGQRSSLT